MSERTEVKVLIAAGGTGGHILPAIALGRELVSRHSVEVLYLCGQRPVELELYRRSGIDPIVVPARQLGAGLRSRLRGLWHAFRVTAFAMNLIRRESVRVVVGMGGYVSGPAMLAAVLARRPTLIHEANSVPGKTNRWLAPWVDVVAVNFPAALDSLRCRRAEVVGMPIREEIWQGCREMGWREFDLEPRRRTLLVVGGSQGARNLSLKLLEALPHLDAPDMEGVQILWSSGTTNFEELDAALRQRSWRFLKIRLLPFISRMDLALAVADAAVSRAGASTIAEFLATGIYALYIPLPIAVYDHQRLNAEQLERAGLGELLPEHAMNPSATAGRIRSLLQKAPERRPAVKAAGQLHRESASKVADLVLQLAAHRQAT